MGVMTVSDPGSPLRVLQLTDPHLMADPSGALLGVNTRDSLDAVIAHIKQSRITPDLILATGDLAQDGSPEAYQVLKHKLQQFDCPALWIPGNHDNASHLRAAVAGTPADQRSLVMGGWLFILLDSAVPGKVYGELAASELAFLQGQLAAHPGMPTLVALHHHPVDIGSDWMARIGLRQPEQLWAALGQSEQVRVLLWGHIHQEWDTYQGGMRLLATPSTCIQFTSGSRRFAVEDIAPGYRWLELYPNGNLQTRVERATEFRFELDSDSTGY